MDEKKSLELMALLDGAEEPGRREALEAWLRSDPDATALRNELSWVREALRSHEPAAKVPESREFYWSQIRRRIDQEAAQAKAKSPAAPSRRFADWISWLAPMAGVAAVTLLVALQPWSGSPLAPGLNEATAMTYTSDTDDVTIHWID